MEKKVFRNVCTNIFLQITLAVNGLLIPRCILIFYGSEMNGVVSSISQFITYAALVEMGIENASVIALYTPIAKNDKKSMEGVVATVGKLYIRSGCVYILIMILLAALYPLLVSQFEYHFVFELMLCIGSVNAIDYFILGKYKVFLIADQKYYVLNIVRTLATIVLTVSSVILLCNNVSVLIVKAFAILSHLGEALSIFIYMYLKYPFLVFRVRGFVKIEQRWNALVYQVCATIVYNTDLIVLTVCLPGRDMSEISVYTVYSMVFCLLTNIVSSLVKGLNASFGNLLAKGENEKLRLFFEWYELLYFMVSFAACICFAVLIVPFVACYTKGIHDAEYARYEIGLLFAVNGLSAQLKDVSAAVNFAAGKIKEVQRYAIEEAVINILVSLWLVRYWGMAGILLGTFISHLWMSANTMNYTAKEVLRNTGGRSVRRIIRNLITGIFLVIVELHHMDNIIQWYSWIIHGICVFTINVLIIVLVNYCFEPLVVRNLAETIKRKVKRKLI